MIKIKTKQEIEKMRQSGKILSQVFKIILPKIKAGLTTRQIDKEIEKIIVRLKAKPSFKNFLGYQYASCISVNEELVHGLPSGRVIAQGDIVGVDIGVEYQGYHADAAVTIPVDEISSSAKKLLSVTEASLHKAIEQISSGVSLQVIQATIYQHATSNGLSVVRSLTGHGIGKNLQEPPTIANYVDKNNPLILQEGMTICIEPMFTAGNHHVVVKEDGWTVRTKDYSLAAHFEHTLLVTKNGCEILTPWSSGNLKC